jgi:hypothetical protein
MSEESGVVQGSGAIQDEISRMLAVGSQGEIESVDVAPGIPLTESTQAEMDSTKADVPYLEKQTEPVEVKPDRMQQLEERLSQMAAVVERFASSAEAMQAKPHEVAQEEPDPMETTDFEAALSDPAAFKTAIQRALDHRMKSANAKIMALAESLNAMPSYVMQQTVEQNSAMSDIDRFYSTNPHLDFRHAVDPYEAQKNQVMVNLAQDISRRQPGLTRIQVLEQVKNTAEKILNVRRDDLAGKPASKSPTQAGLPGPKKSARTEGKVLSASEKIEVEIDAMAKLMGGFYAK